MRAATGSETGLRGKLSLCEPDGAAPPQGSLVGDWALPLSFQFQLIAGQPPDKVTLGECKGEYMLTVPTCYFPVSFPTLPDGTPTTAANLGRSPLVQEGKLMLYIPSDRLLIQ